MTDALSGLKAALAKRSGTNAEDWYPVFKARQGMFVAFDQMRRAREAAGLPQGRVVTQLFTCCTAVDPIVAAGLAPVYGDLSPRTLALDPERMPLDDRTCGVVIQHTYGIQDPVLDARSALVARQAGALALEDCAHCAGRLSRDEQGAPVADLSFHSFGVEKMLPTHFGGAVWVNPAMADRELRAAIVAALSGLAEVAPRRARAARAYRNQIRVIGHLPAGMGKALRERLEGAGRFEPAISAVELAGGLGSTAALPDAWVAEKARAALEGSDAADRQRERAVGVYRELFSGSAVAPGDEAWVAIGGTEPPQPLLRFGFFRTDAEAADAAVQRVRAAGFYAVPWYRPVLFPGVTDPAAYGLADGVEKALGSLPVTCAASRGAVALPTDLSPDQVRACVGAARG